MWVFSLFPIRASHPSFPVVYPPLIFLSFCLFPVKVSSSSQPITFQNQFLKLRKAIKITFKEPFSSSISDVAFLNPWLTCDQVTISFIPSHCWSLKEFSMFSLPQISILASYVQIFWKWSLLPEKRPPAVVGILTGRVRSMFLLSISLQETGYQQKLSFQVNLPSVISEPAIHSEALSLITWMVGHSTVFLSCFDPG